MYVVLDVPKYCGPVVFPGHPSWVAIEPLSQRHDRCPQWSRLQLPVVLAWGITVHKSQGLTFSDGCVVDFDHHPAWKPVAEVGLAFVAMSRSREWEAQAFRDLPAFWDFRKVLKDELFQWRAAAEERFDECHDWTMQQLRGARVTVDEDLQAHLEWTRRQRSKEAQRQGKEPEELTAEYMADVRGMLAQRGVHPPGEYPDEPRDDRGAVQGGGGRSRATGMRPTPKRKPRAKSAAKVTEPEKKRARVCAAAEEGDLFDAGAPTDECPDLEAFLGEAEGLDDAAHGDFADFFGDCGLDGCGDEEDLNGFFGGFGLDGGEDPNASKDRGDQEDPSDKLLTGPFAADLQDLEEHPSELEESGYCSRCGKAGHQAGNCPSFPLSRLQHEDAFSKGRGPHLRQVNVLCQGDRLRVDGVWYVQGFASPTDCNCLIDTLRQKLGVQADLHVVRQGLRERFPVGSTQVTKSNFLELEAHWRATVELLGEDPSRLRVICVDLRGGKGMANHGDSLGDGSRALYIARVHGNHFVPLLPAS